MNMILIVFTSAVQFIFDLALALLTNRWSKDSNQVSSDSSKSRLRIIRNAAFVVLIILIVLFIPVIRRQYEEYRIDTIYHEYYNKFTEAISENKSSSVESYWIDNEMPTKNKDYIDEATFSEEPGRAVLFDYKFGDNFKTCTFFVHVKTRIIYHGDSSKNHTSDQLIEYSWQKNDEGTWKIEGMTVYEVK